MNKIEMPEGIERDLELVRRKTGTIWAESDPDYYGACERVFAFAQSVIDAAKPQEATDG